MYYLYLEGLTPDELDNIQPKSAFLFPARVMMEKHMWLL